MTTILIMVKVGGLSTGMYVNGLQDPSFPVRGSCFMTIAAFPSTLRFKVSFLKITIDVPHLGLPIRNHFPEALVHGQRKESLVYLCMLYINF